MRVLLNDVLVNNVTTISPIIYLVNLSTLIDALHQEIKHILLNKDVRLFLKCVQQT